VEKVTHLRVRVRAAKWETRAAQERRRGAGRAPGRAQWRGWAGAGLGLGLGMHMK